MLRTFFCADMDVFALIPIHIALDAEGGAYMFFAVHELTHKIKSENADAYRLLSDFVLDKLEESELYQSLSQGEGSTLEERIASVQALYEKRGQTLTRDEAIEEIVCDAIPVILSDEQTVLEFVSADRTLAQRVYDFFEKFYEELTKQIANLVYGSSNKAEYDALSNDAETVREIADLLKAALETGRSAEMDESDIDRQYAELEEAGSAIEEGDSGRRKWFSAQDGGIGAGVVRLSQKSDASTTIKEQIRLNLDRLNAMRPVKSISLSETANMGKRQVLDFAVSRFGAHAVIDKAGYGKVVFGKNQIDIGLKHVDIKNHPEESAVILAVPSVIKQGIEIGRDLNHAGVGQKTITFGAPINLLDGEIEHVVNVGVVVIEERKNYYHAHQVLLPDGSVLKVGDKNKTATGLAVASSKDAVVAPTVTASANIIRNPQEENNPSGENSEETFYNDLVNGENRQTFSMKSTQDSDGNTLSEQQAAYFADSKVRDAEGNLMVVYHGSGAVFTEFDGRFMSSHDSSEGQGFYFTNKKEMAERYQEQGGQLLQGYLNISHPLSDSEVTLTKAELRRIVKAVDPTGDDVVLNYDSRGGMGYPSPAWYNRAMTDTVNMIYDSSDSDSEILAELANAGAGYETVTATVREKFGYDGYIVEGKYDDATVYVAFTSDQFKNLDNKTPTDSKEIRYSTKSRGTDDFYDTLVSNDRRAEYDAQQREILEEDSEWDGEGRAASLATSEKVFRNLAKSILQKASSRYSVDSLTDDLKALFHMVGDQARTETQRIARKVLNQSSARDDTMYDATYDARRYFRRGRFALSEKQKREAEIAYDGYNNYRRSLMGKLNLKNDGIPLDQAWGEICEMFPGYFEEDTKEGDQPQKVKEFLDAAYERPYINPYGTRYNIDDAASELADELLAAFSNIRQRKTAESQPDNESQPDKERETTAKTPGEMGGFSFERPTTRQGRLQKAWELYDNNMNPQKYYEQSAEKTRQLREMKLFEDGKTSDEMFDLKTNNLLRGLMLRNGENVGGALADNSMQRVTEIFSRAKKRLAIPSAASALELFRRRLLFLHEQQPDCHDHGEDQQIPSCAHAMRDRRRIDHECRAYHGGDGHDKALEHRHFLFPLHEHHKDGQIHCVDRNDRKLRGIKRDRTEPRVLHQISAKEIGQPDGAQHHAHNG